MGWRGAHLITTNRLDGFQDSGPGLGVLAVDRSGCQAVGQGLKEGSRPHFGKVMSQKPIISAVLPLNIPCLSWNALWQLATANLLTSTHGIHQQFVQHSSHAPVSWNLKETTTILPFYL